MSARRFIVAADLPKRAIFVRATREKDIEDTFDALRRKVINYAQQYTVTGWTLTDHNEWELALAGDRCVIVARMTRPD